MSGCFIITPANINILETKSSSSLTCNSKFCKSAAEALYKALYERMDEYTSRPAEAIIIIEEYMYHSNFRIDKEINIASALAKIIETKKPQII